MNFITLGVFSLLFLTTAEMGIAADVTQNNGVVTSKLVAPMQAKIIQNDVQALDLLDPSYDLKLKLPGSSTPEPVNDLLKKALKIADLKPATLLAWLQTRIRYIVSELETADKIGFLTQEDHPYPNISVMPEFEIPAGTVAKERPDSSSEPKQIDATEPAGHGRRPMVVMANLGTQLYYILKNTGKAGGFVFFDPTAEDPKPVFVSSPRIGLLAIGEGLFQIGANGEDITALSNQIVRLGTLFHESRHSDGNGKSLGFPHAVCPESLGAFANLNACDRNGNGPYTIGALFLAKGLGYCMGTKQCSTSEVELMKLMVIDNLSRVLEPSVMLDDTPEGV